MYGKHSVLERVFRLSRCADSIARILDRILENKIETRRAYVSLFLSLSLSPARARARRGLHVRRSKLEAAV
jgi:hypothetical protein